MYCDEIDERAREIAKYVAATGATVRSAAVKFGVSKSTVHKDLTQRLKQIDADLYKQVEQVLLNNLRQRHIRGGLATKEKYARKVRKGGLLEHPRP